MLWPRFPTSMLLMLLIWEQKGDLWPHSQHSQHSLSHTNQPKLSSSLQRSHLTYVNELTTIPSHCSFEVVWCAVYLALISVLVIKGSNYWHVDVYCGIATTLAVMEGTLDMLIFATMLETPGVSGALCPAWSWPWVYTLLTRHVTRGSHVTGQHFYPGDIANNMKTPFRHLQDNPFIVLSSS